jgi:glycosyltransferase involved in cell wall biosynthesis
MKVVFISGMYPHGHLSHFLVSGLNNIKNLDLIIYCEKIKTKNNFFDKNWNIKKIWSKNFKFVFQIFKEIVKDKPDLVHLQHEINMYGGKITSILFPILILFIKLTGAKIVVTIHSAVPKKFINDHMQNFFFTKAPKIFLFFFFRYLFFLIRVLSDKIIVHTNLSKKILVNDYSYDISCIKKIEFAIPQRVVNKIKKKKFFFYFGYLTRRKGLEIFLKSFSHFIKDYKNYKFIMAGGVIPGQEQAKIEILHLIKRLKIEKFVKYVGFIQKPSQQAYYYNNATAIIIPAIKTMGSSGPLLHANSHEKCSIVTSEGHLKEEISNMQNGILVKNNNWYKSLKFVIENKKTLKKIENNVSVIKRLRNPDNIASKYFKLYKALNDK